MTESAKKIKQVCKCENCGNEAEMVVTCTLPGPEPTGTQASSNPAVPPKKMDHKIKGTATCSHCGNEADMWVDISAYQ